MVLELFMTIIVTRGWCSVSPWGGVGAYPKPTQWSSCQPCRAH